MPATILYLQLVNIYCMKKLILPAILFITLIACNSSENKNSQHEHGSDEPKTAKDSLMKDVMDGHDFAMAKMGRLSSTQKLVQQSLDSINKLPAKSRQAAAGYTTQLDSLLKDLQYAENSMNRWMAEFNMDSSVRDPALQLKYLESEKQKIAAVKDNIFTSLKRADSLLKK